VTVPEGVGRLTVLLDVNAQTLRLNEFWIDKYPVTRGQFARPLQATGYELREDRQLRRHPPDRGHVPTSGQPPPTQSAASRLPMTHPD